MSYFRSLSATLLSAASSFCLVTASGCGTAAVGVDDCRDIERARCHAGKPCGIVEDIPACERYYRDHCLHGLAGKAPGATAVGACVQVIEAAGRCAESDPEIRLADCDPEVTAPHTGLSRACDVVAHPERSDECAFLADLPEDEGSGGAPGSAGQPADEGSGASSGAGGRAGAGGEPSQGGAPAE
jgi:hypothetical protein